MFSHTPGMLRTSRDPVDQSDKVGWVRGGARKAPPTWIRCPQFAHSLNPSSSLAGAVVFFGQIFL